MLQMHHSPWQYPADGGAAAVALPVATGAVAPGASAHHAALAAASPAPWTFAGGPSNAMPVNLDRFRTLKLVGMNGPHPVFELGNITDAFSAAEARACFSACWT